MPHGSVTPCAVPAFLGFRSSRRELLRDRGQRQIDEAAVAGDRLADEGAARHRRETEIEEALLVGHANVLVLHAGEPGEKTCVGLTTTLLERTADRREIGASERRAFLLFSAHAVLARLRRDAV